MMSCLCAYDPSVLCKMLMEMSPSSGDQLFRERAVRNCEEAIVILHNNRAAAIGKKTLFLLISCVEQLWRQFPGLQNKTSLEFSACDAHESKLCLLCLQGEAKQRECRTCLGVIGFYCWAECELKATPYNWKSLCLCVLLIILFRKAVQVGGKASDKRNK